MKTTIEIGTRVVRISGGPGYEGHTGTVVDATGARFQVKWDDRQVPNFYRPEEMNTRPGKRTWVKVSVVQAI